MSGFRSEEDLRVDRRRFAADGIARALFAEIVDLLPYQVQGEVMRRLLWSLHSNGVMLIRDSEREQLGLPLLDEKGWTESERVEHERERLRIISEWAHSVAVGNILP